MIKSTKRSVEFEAEVQKSDGLLMLDGFSLSNSIPIATTLTVCKIYRLLEHTKAKRVRIRVEVVR